VAVPRPVIGIACAVLPAQWGPWHQPAAVVAADYIHQVQAAGGIAVVIPPQPGDPGDVLDRIDALMLTGGNDLQAYLYGDEPHAEAEAPDPGRDAWEFGLVRQAIARDMPFLGICRGMQVMNVAFGGTLTQHLPESLGTTDHRRTTGSFDGNDHLVDLQDGSLVARAAGEVVHSVPSHHHQAVDRVGEGLVLSGVSSGDGVAEAIEMPGRRFALGVQWHPEADPTSAVIAALVDAARGA
jgi:putative glutamine amidotransferase